MTITIVFRAMVYLHWAHGKFSCDAELKKNLLF